MWITNVCLDVLWDVHIILLPLMNFLLSSSLSLHTCLMCPSGLQSEVTHWFVDQQKMKWQVVWLLVLCFLSWSVWINTTDDLMSPVSRNRADWMILMIFMFLMNISSFSLQFAVLMWILTYVGALFNGLTLLILGEETGTCCFPWSLEFHNDEYKETA